MFRSLGYRNFRLFFFGQFLSLCGTWMQVTAQSWLVYRLTRDPLLLGLVNFVNHFPVFLFGFLAGQVADRLSHRRVVFITQSLAMIQAVVLAALTLSGSVAVWHIFVLALLLGAVSAFDFPARQVLVGELVEPADRQNAIALNSFVVNAARMLGPALAGFLIAGYGEGICFALNAASFVSILAALRLMRPAPQPPSPAPSTVGPWREIGAGLAYALREDPIRLLLFQLVGYSLAGLPLYVLLPVLAEEVFGTGARGLGILSSFSGLGAAAGALLLARRRRTEGTGGVIAANLMVFAASLGVLALTRSFPVGCALMFLSGFSAIEILAGTNTLLQELSSARYRGRVVSFYGMTFIGLAPIGSFLVGGLASRLGIAWTLGIQSAVCLAVAGAYRRRLSRLGGSGAEGRRDPLAEQIPA